MDYLDKARRVLDIESSEIARLRDRLDGSFITAVEALVRCMERRGKIVLLGVGKSGNIAEKISATLTSTGTLSVVMHTVNALHGDLGVVADGDVILALSYSGETEEMIRILPFLRRFDVEIIAITGNAQSTLAQNSHIHLDIHVEQEACPLNLAPTSSTTTMLALGDALAMVVLEARGFNQNDFARFHPGGQLGRSLLLKVRDIMRPLDRTPLVREDIAILEVLREMTGKRAGAAVIVDAGGLVAGIFTDGDFVRQFQANPGLGAQPVSVYMTPRPITISGHKLAVEVLKILEHQKIDDLIVVDETGRPIGLVDSQDLTKVKLI